MNGAESRRARRGGCCVVVAREEVRVGAEIIGVDSRRRDYRSYEHSSIQEHEVGAVNYISEGCIYSGIDLISTKA